MFTNCEERLSKYVHSKLRVVTSHTCDCYNTGKLIVTDFLLKTTVKDLDITVHNYQICNIQFEIFLEDCVEEQNFNKNNARTVKRANAIYSKKGV